MSNSSRNKLNSDPEHLRNENDQHQTWVPKEHGKSITINSNIRADQQQVYQDNFPRISSNFDKQAPKTNTNNVRSDRPPVNPPNLPKTNHLAAPAPYTVVQNYADRLRYNQAKCDVPIILTAPEITTKQGLPAVLYVKEEVMRDLAAACKFTLIGKFSYTMPKLELIRKNFILQTQLSGGVKISHFNSRHVYIDLDNELDYNMVWTKQRMSIAGQVMRIQVWTPNFKPAEEIPIVPIWISLPELPWHFYNKEFVTGLLSPIGKVLYLDSASIKKSRGSQASVKESSHSLEVLDNYKSTKGDNRPHTAATNQKGQDEYNRKIANAGKDTTKQLQVDIISKQVTEINKGKEVYTGQAGTCIDSMLPSPNPIDNVDNIIAEVAVGGLDGREQETHTELQEGMSKRGGGGELTPFRHEEVEFDQSGDSRAPATPFNNQQKITNAQVTDTRQQQGKFNNKSGDRLSKKKREAIKKRLQQSMGTDTAGIDISQQTDAEQVIHTSRVMVPPDDNGALNSEDDLDPDNQSLEESDEDAEDTMKHTGQVVGSSFQDKCTDVQRITEQ
ncbi:hypothetical protein KY289_001445 [Solanum tuberosum]|nr:hypothetical protein KY289_001445 [Solanum tuberosum]